MVLGVLTPLPRYPWYRLFFANMGIWDYSQYLVWIERVWGRLQHHGDIRFGYAKHHPSIQDWTRTAASCNFCLVDEPLMCFKFWMLHDFCIVSCKFSTMGYFISRNKEILCCWSTDCIRSPIKAMWWNCIVDIAELEDLRDSWPISVIGKGSVITWRYLISIHEIAYGTRFTTRYTPPISWSDCTRESGHTHYVLYGHGLQTLLHL